MKSRTIGLCIALGLFAAQAVAQDCQFTSDRNVIRFSEFGGTEEIRVDADCPWDIYDMPNWIGMEKAGYLLTITCPPNHIPDDFEGDIVLRNEYEKDLRIHLVQDKCSNYIELSANLIENAKGSAAVYRIEVTSTKPWRVESRPDWCTVTDTDEGVKVSLEENNSGADREGEIIIAAPELDYLRKTVTIRQANRQNYLVISPQILQAGSGKSAQAAVTVTTDMSSYSVVGLPEWCKLKSQDAGSFVIAIADNSGGEAREAQCQVVAGDVSETFTVKQGARLNYINLSSSNVSASKRGGLLTIRVTASGAWKVVNLPAWCEITEQDGSSFKLRISPNEGNARNAVFSVSCGALKEDISVKQE